jgi:hypothetical protein
MAGMDILRAVPWQVYPLLLVGLTVIIVIRNSIKYRREFGGSSTIEDIKTRYPRAKVFPLRPKKKD